MHSRQFLLKSLRKYPFLVALTILMGFSSALFNGVSTILIVPILLELLGETSALTNELPEVLQRALVIFDGVPERFRLFAMMFTVVSMIVLKNATVYAGSLASNKLNQKQAAQLRLEGLSILLDVDLAYYTKTKVGDLVNHLNVEVNRTTTAVRTLARMATTIITILVFVGFLIALSWQLTLISTTVLGLVALINQTAIKQSKVYGAELSKYSHRYSSHIIEILSGIRLVKGTANEASEYSTVSKLITEREVAEYRSQLLFAGIAPINEVCSIIALIAIAWLGRIVMAEELEAFSSILLTYLITLFRMLPSIGYLNSTRSQLANVGPSVAIVSNFLRRDDKPFMANGTSPYTELKSGIRFRHLTFSYPGHKKQVIQGIDLHLKKGTTLALVGASGAGKSTLADLLPRFYDPTKGRIDIDGKDLRKLDIHSFRRRLGIVSQDTFLFNDTVRQNLIYGRPNATDAEIRDAMERANAHEFIDALPEGLETLIGDRGVLLSGGQRQRLAIARALLQDPDILILDEATSALDTISEKLVQKAIDELSRDRTTLVIAHRLSTVQNADQIAVLDQGRVVETGTHTTLLEKDGYYAKLCAIQFSEQAKEDKTDSADSPQLSPSLEKTAHNIKSNLGSVAEVLKRLADGDDEGVQRDHLAAAAYSTTLAMITEVEILERSGKIQTTGDDNDEQGLENGERDPQRNDQQINHKNGQSLTDGDQPIIKAPAPIL